MIYPASVSLYADVNGKVDKMTEFFHIILMITLPIVLFPDLIKSYHLYYVNDFGAESFTLPFPAWWSFINWRTPNCYLIPYFSQWISCLCMAKILQSNLSIVLGSCGILIAIAKDLKLQLNQMNAVTENHIELKKELLEFIKFHIDARWLSEKFYCNFSINFNQKLKIILFFSFQYC